MKKTFGGRLLRVCLTLAVFAVAFQVYACIATYAARRVAMPDNFGNFERVRAALPPGGPERPLSFMVVGDTRSKGTFEGLAEDIRASSPDFIVILGDWVDDGSPDQHAYFRQEASEYAFSCPVFFTPGNHDVDPRDYPLDRFEADYGPRNFTFAYKDSIFIFISYLDKRFSNETSLNYLQSFDPETIAQYRNRFVFMHIPPWISPDIKERHTKDEKKLIEIFQKLNINYVIAADFHGYNRTRSEGIDYIITGGGGARLDTTNGKQFHHAVSIKSDEKMFSERILPAKSIFEVNDWIEYNSVVYIGPFIINHAYTVTFINMIVLIALFLILRAGKQGKDQCIP